MKNFSPIRNLRWSFIEFKSFEFAVDGGSSMLWIPEMSVGI
jgi:hypothetical protein